MTRQTAPSRAYAIDGKEIFVFDGLFSRALIKRVHDEFDALDYMRKRNVEMNDGFAEWTVSLDLAAQRRHPVVQTTATLLRDVFPGHTMALKQSYCKNLCYGDCPYPHTDAPSDLGGLVISTVYYANPTWEPSWGGETMFFDDRRDARISVAPVPGRLVIFRGVLWHRAGVPMRNCKASRYSLINKFFGTPKKRGARRSAAIECTLVRV